MSVRFNPSGTLDVATDPLDLPEQTDGKNSVSGAMTRCTNLTLDRPGIAATRKGTNALNGAAVDTDQNLVVEVDGKRFLFAGTKIYVDEAPLLGSFTNADWSGVSYKAYNSDENCVFAVNGTDRVRVTESGAYEWGLEAPVDAPEIAKDTDWCCTCEWEILDPALYDLNGYAEENTWACTQIWEKDHVTDGSVVFFAVLLTGEFYLSEGTIEMPISIGLWWFEYLLNNVIRLTAAQFSARKIGFTASYLSVDWDITHEWEENSLSGAVVVSRGYDCRCWWFEYENYMDQSGLYACCYTYCRVVDGILECESNPSPSTTSRFGSGGVLQIAVPDDPQVTHYRLYRTLVDGETFYYHSQIPISSVMGGFYLADTELGTEVETDHNRPPLGSVVAGPNFDGSLFMAKGSDLYSSKPKQAEYWPALSYLEISRPGDDIQAICYLGTSAFVASLTEIWQIQGTSSATFFPLPMGAQTGTRSKRCFCPVQGQGVFHLGPDGIYQFRVGSDSKITDSTLGPVFNGETSGSIPGINRTYLANCWMVSFGGKLWFGFPGGTDQYPKNVLLFDFAQERTVHYQYPFFVQTVAVDTENKRLLAGCTDGYVRVLDDSTATDDDGTEISWQLESKEFGGLRKYFPRTARYDVTVGEGATANGYVVLDGSVKQTHAITENRKTRKRLVTGCTGDRLSIRLTGTGDVDIYSAEVE